jgi:hypothetical protein
MSEANKVQVGGSHYKQDADKPQHWDLSIIYQWDPFQYQITKYVMRWKDKHATPEERVKDLQKARHFLDKYLENWQAFDTHKTSVAPTAKLSAPAPSVGVAVAVPDLDARQTRVVTLSGQLSTGTQGKVDGNWSVEGYLGNGDNVYKCAHCKAEVMATSVEGAYQEHPNCALAHQYFAAP